MHHNSIILLICMLLYYRSIIRCITDPGRIENNPLWVFHETFNQDKDWVAEAKDQYQQGKIGDVVCKKK